jgi:hypothetical protein
MIRKINDQNEMEICIDMYLLKNDETFVSASRSASLSALKDLLKDRAFMRVLVNDEDQIQAWILAKRTIHAHMADPVFHQLYFGSRLTGIKAVKAVVALHHSLEREAKRLGIKRLISMSNHLDERNTFVRILEKEGWDRRHYLATKTV